MLNEYTLNTTPLNSKITSTISTPKFSIACPYHISQMSSTTGKYDINIAKITTSLYNILYGLSIDSGYNINAKLDIISQYDIDQGISYTVPYHIITGNTWDVTYNISAWWLLESRYAIESPTTFSFNASYNINQRKYIVSAYDLYHIPTQGELRMPGAKAELDKAAWLQTGHVVDNAITKSKAAIEQIEVTVASGETEGTATVSEGAMVLGFVPTGNMDQYVDNIAISDTTLTVTLASAATADNTINVTVINA